MKTGNSASMASSSYWRIGAVSAPPRSLSTAPCSVSTKSADAGCASAFDSCRTCPNSSPPSSVSRSCSLPSAPLGQLCPQRLRRFFRIFRRPRKSARALRECIERCHQLGGVDRIVPRRYCGNLKPEMGSPSGSWYRRYQHFRPAQCAETSNSSSSFFEFRFRIARHSTSSKPKRSSIAA